MKPLFAVLSLVALVVLFLTSCALNSGRYLDIAAQDIPIYPNADSVVQDGPSMNELDELYTWTFTTPDTPEMVWQYYKDEMGKRWGFYEPQSNSFDKTLIVQSCPFYSINMTTSEITQSGQEIMLHFRKQPCL